MTNTSFQGDRTGPSILIVIGILFTMLLAIMVRLYDLDDLPLDFNATRQLHSATIARGMYYEHKADAEAWQRDLAVRQWKNQGLIEPQIMERLSAIGYQLVGQELLWLPRLLSILFWLLGGWALLSLLKSALSPIAALLGLAFFALLPFGVIASRAFMPDPLMVGMIALSYLAFYKFMHKQTLTSALIAGIIAGLTIYVKTTAVFFILFPFAAALLGSKNLGSLLKDKQVWLLGILTILPYALYFIYAYFVTGFLQSEFGLRFFPELWGEASFYFQWKGMLDSTIGFHWVLLALVGSLLIDNKDFRNLLLGAWLGYTIYGFTFAYHTITHDYYQLPAVLLTVMGLAALAHRVFSGGTRLSRGLVTGLAAVFILAVILAAWTARVDLKRNDYRHEAVIWRELGNVLGKDAKVVGLTHDYGFRLYYWGWVASDNWLSSGDYRYRALADQEFDMSADFAQLVKDKDYFVVTLFNDFDNQPKLKNTLVNNYPVYASGDGYIIYDLKAKK